MTPDQPTRIAEDLRKLAEGYPNDYYTAQLVREAADVLIAQQAALKALRRELDDVRCG